MADRLYDDFCDPTEEYNKAEPRGFVYDISRDLIKKAKMEEGDDWVESDKTVKGILLLLFCWNYAYPGTKKLKHNEISKLMDESKKDIKKLQEKTITNFDEEDYKIITNLFENFKELLGQTGASKALSLLNPKLFLMWDTKIRKRLDKELIPGISKGDPQHYLKYLKSMKYIIEKNELGKKIKDERTLAKKIDEYNYLKIIKE